jgi:membrane protein DedA with SNARE-associated domain
VNVDAMLQTIPPLAVYFVVGAVIGIESLGIPLPGEIALVSAALLASRHTLDINPVAVGAAATIGAIIGDTIGYSIGRKFGMSLFERLGNRFPKHFGPGHVALAKRLFTRWGVWAVFFGRFIALLRIFAGPPMPAAGCCGPEGRRPSSTTRASPPSDGCPGFPGLRSS